MSETTKIRIAHSPDSDDAFMFYALTQGLLDLGLVLGVEVARGLVEHDDADVVEWERPPADVVDRAPGRCDNDVDTAIEVVKFDRKVDSKYVSITRQLVTYMAQDPKSIPKILNILWAARAMERMGDRCQNIAEHTIYMVLGTDVRHIKLDDVLAEIEAQLGPEDPE